MRADSGNIDSDHAGASDLVVVGGGIAGLTTALRGAELGLRVSVLEQGDDARYACNTRFSGGILHAAFHDPNRPVDELRAILTQALAPIGDPALVDTVAVDARRFLAWLRGHDVRFMRVGPAEAHRWCMAPPKPIGPGLEWRGRGADMLLRTLTDALRARGGSIVLGASAERLARTSDGAWIVLGTMRGVAAQWRARGVAICDGGFQGDLAQLREHVGPAPELLLQRGAANSRGDGMRMAVAVGAAVGGLDAFYGHVQSRDALTDPRVWPYPELDNVATAAIVVDAGGRRLCDEGLGGISIANALARLPDPTCATIVLDSAIWEKPGRSARFPANPFLERYGGTVHRADTLDALAAKAGIAGAPLITNVNAYNDALTRNGLSKLVPARSAAKLRAWPIVVPPFLAIPLCVGITYTMGGLVIDGNGCVLDRAGQRIAGLYAAGSATTGLDGRAPNGFVAYVGGLVKAVFGLRAAEHLAGALQASEAVPAAAD